MESKDRFLIVIVVGIVLLVAAVFLVILLRADQPTYRPDDTPEAVAHNYLLALRRGDYETAYGYLSPSVRYRPASVSEFADDVRGSYAFGSPDNDVTFAFKTVISEATKSTIEVTETEYYQDLFEGREYHHSFDVKLEAEDDGWKIVEAERYWNSCWDTNRSWCR